MRSDYGFISCFPSYLHIFHFYCFLGSWINNKPFILIRIRHEYIFLTSLLIPILSYFIFLFSFRFVLLTRPDRCRRSAFIIIMTISVSQRLDNPPQLTLRVDQVAGTRLGFQHLIRLCPLTCAQRGHNRAQPPACVTLRTLKRRLGRVTFLHRLKSSLLFSGCEKEFL